MSIEESQIHKRMWNDENTKWLITEFKKYYEEWKDGKISKKNQMWQKVAQALKEHGVECSAGQAENRFKTLQRSYRKSCGIFPTQSRQKKLNPFTDELSSIFLENLSNNSIDADDDSIIITENNESETDENIQFLDEETGSIFTLAPQLVSSSRQQSEPNTMYEYLENENDYSNNSTVILKEEDNDSDNPKLTSIQRKGTKLYKQNTRRPGNIRARIDKIINSNEEILNNSTSTSFDIKNTSTSRIRYAVARRKPVTKNSVEVLLEIKELLKKIEIRRQARHEQNIKIAKERNAILKRKNQLLERLIAKVT